MIAGIKGIKYSKNSEKSKKLIGWGVVVALFSLAGVAMNMVNGGEFSITNILTGVAVPVLYIYGAVLNSKSSGTYTA